MWQFIYLIIAYIIQIQKIILPYSFSISFSLQSIYKPFIVIIVNQKKITIKKRNYSI